MIRPPPRSPLFPSTPLSRSENILMWSEAALIGHSELDAYNSRQVFAVTPSLPVYRAAYGAYGAKGYLFAHNQGTLFRFNANGLDRKSTRLNSSHLVISYAVF